MNNYLKNNPLIDAIIYLKNGKRKYGVLLENSLLRSDVFHFISSANLQLFQKTNNPEFIEIVPGNLIYSIGTDLK